MGTTTTTIPTTLSPTNNKLITHIPTTLTPSTKIPTISITTTSDNYWSTTSVEPSDTTSISTETSMDNTISTQLMEDISTTSLDEQSGEVQTTINIIHPSETDDSLQLQTEQSAANEWLYIAVPVGLPILAVLIVGCLFILNKKKQSKLKQGEPARHSVLSQEIARSNSDIEQNDDSLYDEESEEKMSIAMEGNVNTHSLQIPLSMESNVTIKHMLREGNIAQIMNTPQIPEMKEQITEEELDEIKRKYEKKKSTADLIDFHRDHLFGINMNMDKDEMDRESREDSEELYMDINNEEDPALQLYHTPTFVPQQSDTSETVHSGNPTKVIGNIKIIKSQPTVLQL